MLHVIKFNGLLLVATFFLLSSLFCACTPKSKILSIAQEQLSKANTPESTPVPGETISKKVEPKIIEMKGNSLTPASPIEGDLIQTGGSIESLATKLAIESGINADNVLQVLWINEYLKEHWHYIYDPYKDRDTWRSAEVTIALRHKEKFPGDCDDFAILNASVAKQIGLRARVIGGYAKDEGGHAFAEFFLPHNEINLHFVKNYDHRNDSDGYWLSLDWFKGVEHNKYIRDTNILAGD
jgi:hypothetical protein